MAVKSVFRIFRRKAGNAFIDSTSLNDRMAEALEASRRDLIKLLDSSTAVGEQVVGAERQLDRLRKEHQRVREVAKRALLSGNEAQFKQLSGQVKVLEVQVAEAETQTAELRAASEQLRQQLQAQLNQRTAEELRIRGLVTKAQFGKAWEIVNQHQEYALGLQKKSRNPALESLEREANKRSDRAIARSRDLAALSSGSATSYDLAMGEFDAGAEEVMAELRAELGMGPKALPPAGGEA